MQKDRDRDRDILYIDIIKVDYGKFFAKCQITTGPFPCSFSFDVSFDSARSFIKNVEADQTINIGSYYGQSFTYQRGTGKIKVYYDKMYSEFTGQLDEELTKLFIQKLRRIIDDYSKQPKHPY